MEVLPASTLDCAVVTHGRTIAEQQLTIAKNIQLLRTFRDERRRVQLCLDIVIMLL
jgi:hypothetical protein